MRALYILFIFLLAVTGSHACDFCNCYLGLDPGYNKNAIGIRNSWRTAEWVAPATSFRLTQATHGDESSASGETLHETFVNMELFVKYSPIPKLRIIASLPYAINTLEYDGEKESRNAVSDLTLMAMYQLANTMPHDSVSVRHRVFAGGGVKFPTGKSEGASDVDIPMAHHLYSGTGSTDYMVAVSYIGKLKHLGWNLDASYKFNTPSANDYRYGNTFNITPRVFYEAKLKAVKLFPHLGAAFETGEYDEYDNVKLEQTGGSILYGSAGADLYYGAFSITTDFRLPLYYDMGEQVAEDQSWLLTSINFHF